MMACFWTEWLMSYQKSCKSKKQECKCERRRIVDVEEKFQKQLTGLFGVYLYLNLRPGLINGYQKK